MHFCGFVQTNAIRFSGYHRQDQQNRDIGITVLATTAFDGKDRTHGVIGKGIRNMSKRVPKATKSPAVGGISGKVNLHYWLNRFYPNQLGAAIQPRYRAYNIASFAREFGMIAQCGLYATIKRLLQ